MKKKSFGLIKGRHQIENVSEFIFDDAINDVTDIDSMMVNVQDKLKDVSEVDIFVTGLTVALVSVINFCSLHHIKLTLHHFNRETNGWFVQEVFTDIHKQDLIGAGLI